MSDHSQQNGLPASWVWTSIQEIANTQTGGTPSRTEPEYFRGKIPWVKSGELRDGYVYETEETISERGLNESNAKLLRAGTLCIALYGATVGRLGILGIDAATNQAVCGILLPGVVNTGYVFRYLESIRSSLIAQGKGGAQSNISNGIVRNTRVPLAPANEQRRIVEKIEELFSDLDAGVAALERARAKLKRYRASVLKAAVEGSLTAEWRAKHPNVEPASKLLERILKARRRKWEADQLAKFATAGKQPAKNSQAKYVELAPPVTSGPPGLPEGWCWATLPQIGILDRGRSRHRPRNASHLYGGPYPFVQTGNIRHSDTFIREFEQTYSEEGLAQSRLWPAGTMCITIAANIAETAILAFDACFPDSVAGFIPDSDHVSVRFVELFFRTVQQRLEAFAPATAQKNINIETLAAVAVPVPPSDEQMQIVAEADSRLSVIIAAERQIVASFKRAARLRQCILKQAFEGKLVPQDPSDEPASALLERLESSRFGQEAGGNGQSRTRRRGRRRQSVLRSERRTDV
jgi:type I restriction enzyme, S subunit